MGPFVRSTTSDEPRGVRSSAECLLMAVGVFIACEYIGFALRTRVGSGMLQHTKQPRSSRPETIRF